MSSSTSSLSRRKLRRARNTCFGLINSSDSPDASSFKLIIETRCNRCRDHYSTINHDCRRSRIAQEREKNEERERKREKEALIPAIGLLLLLLLHCIFFEFFFLIHIFKPRHIRGGDCVDNDLYSAFIFFFLIFFFSCSFSLSLSLAFLLSSLCSMNIDIDQSLSIGHKY